RTAATARARLAGPPAASVLGDPDTFMKAGLDALYARQDHAGAAVQFRMVLALNPTHYGATYQLAVALDQLGKPEEARRLGEKVLVMAAGAGDEPTELTARRRLARQP